VVDWAALQDLIDRRDETAVASVPRGLDPEQGAALHWAAERGPGGIGVAEEIRRDPRLARLIPRLFELDGVMAWFDTPRSRNGDGWPTALAVLAAEGLVDRGMLLRACLAALGRGGRRGVTRGLLRLHDELAPTLGEVRCHERDYLALLSGTRSTVAGMAQRQLRRLDDAAMLPAGILCQASAAVLLRTEKTLVRAQLDWLNAAARRDPGHAGDLMLAMTAAFGQQPADLQARALKLMLRHVPDLDAATRARLADATGALPDELRARASGSFGPHLARRGVTPRPLRSAPPAAARAPGPAR
jgi:hypothetical protein